MNPITYVGTPLVSSCLYTINTFNFYSYHLCQRHCNSMDGRIDMYIFYRERYRQYRKFLVKDGKEDDFFLDEEVE